DGRSSGARPQLRQVDGDLGGLAPPVLDDDGSGGVLAYIALEEERVGGRAAMVPSRRRQSKAFEQHLAMLALEAQDSLDDIELKACEVEQDVACGRPGLDREAGRGVTAVILGGLLGVVVAKSFDTMGVRERFDDHVDRDGARAVQEVGLLDRKSVV